MRQSEAFLAIYIIGGNNIASVVSINANDITEKEYVLTYDETGSRLWLTKVSEKGGGISLDTKLKYQNKSFHHHNLSEETS